MNPQAQHVANILLAEVGYVETPTNRTKYAVELDQAEKPRIPRNGSAWCGTFMDWGMYKAGALDAQVFRAFGTTACARAYMQAGRSTFTPQPGALAFREYKPGPGHVGFVLEVLSDGKVKTVEGNTSPGWWGSQRNGGQVCIRTRSASYWAVYGLPRWQETPAPVGTLEAIAEAIRLARSTTLRIGDRGWMVKLMQERLGMVSPDNDGIFGPHTKSTLVSFQTFVRLPPTGSCDPRTWAALFGETYPG